MLISSGMIWEELSPVLKNCILNGLDKHLNLKRMTAYEDESTLRADTIYLIPPELSNLTFIENLRIENGTAVVLWENIPIEELTKSAAWFVPNSNLTNFPRIMNQIMGIFEKYQDYDTRLLEMAYTSQDLPHMVSLATGIFKNELTVRNADYQVVARSYTEMYEMKNSGMPQPDEKGIYDPDVINILEEDPAYRNIVPGAVLPNQIIHYHSDAILTNSYFVDLYAENHFIYRVRLSDSRQPFRAYDAALLEHFSGMVREKINHMEFVPERSVPLKSILRGLLSVPYSCSEKDLEILKEELGWQPQANYVCICLSISSTSENLKKRPYYGKVMQQIFLGIYLCEYEDNLVALMNLDIAYGGLIGNFNRELVDFLRDENMRAGYSLKFTDLMQLKFYYHQAAAALDMGEKYQPHTWTHHFRDHIYDWMGKAVRDNFGNVLACDSALQALHSYDLEKGTDLLNTLKAYLDCKQNTVQTAKALFVHRATLNYRLQRIGEITNLNLKDAERVLMVHLLAVLYGRKQ